MMPGYDGTGPRGIGPMTGGARGFCNPASRGYPAGNGVGRGMAHGAGFRSGFGRGRGYGRESGRGFYPGVFPPAYAGCQGSELDALKVQATALKHTLDELNRRIAELGTPSE